MIAPLGNWTCGELLGKGGYADVFACTANNGTPAALKRFHNPEYVKTFERERAALTALTGCPHTPSLLDSGRDSEGKLCLVTTRALGEPLHKRLRQGPLDATTVRRMLSQMLAVLAHAHERGWLHKDIKASNLLYDGQDFTLLDWGIARPVGTGRAGTIRSKSQDAVAPENYVGRHGITSDFYQLGLLAFHALVGRMAYHLSTEPSRDYRVAAHCMEEAELPDGLADPPLCALIAGWLRKPPDQRPVGYDLANLLDTPPSPTAVPEASTFFHLKTEGFLPCAARAGIPYAMHEWAVRLDARQYRDEACFWLEKAAEAGYTRSVRLLQQWHAKNAHEGAPLLLSGQDMARILDSHWKPDLPNSSAPRGINFFLPLVEEGDLFIWLNRDKIPLDQAQERIDEARQRGAIAAIAPLGSQSNGQLPLLEVDNPKRALRKLAEAARRRFDGRCVLVTGSHGKTGFKTQLAHLLRGQVAVHAHLDSYNKELPVMRTLAAIPRNTEVAIVEVAVPAEGIGEKRARLVRPHLCVITGIAPEHMKSHKTLEGLIRNKASVVNGLQPGGQCLLNGDDAHCDALAAEVRQNSDCPILRFGSSPDCAGHLLHASFDQGDWSAGQTAGWQVRANIQGETVEYSLPLLEDYAPLASVGVMLAAKLLGADPVQCAATYPDYRNYQSSGNLYRVNLGTGCFHVYDQTQRGELKGFESMFELMARLQGPGRKIAIISEFINHEDNPDVAVDISTMRALMAAARIDLLITVKDFRLYADAIPSSTEWRAHGDTIAEIRDVVLAEVRPGDMIFLRGVLKAELAKLSRHLLDMGTGTPPYAKIY